MNKLLLYVCIALTSCSTANQKAENVISGTLGKKNNEKTHKIQLSKYRSDGFIKAENHILYNHNGDSIGSISVSSLIPVDILKKSDQKIQLNKTDSPCEMANIVELIFRSDTLLLSGANVLEVKKTIVSNDSLRLLLAHDFLLRSMYQEEPTGCDGYGYLIIQDKGQASFIKPSNNEFCKDLPFTVLISNDGMEDSIIAARILPDKIEMDIFVGFQEGTGKYKLSLFKKENRWTSSETNRKRLDTIEPN